MMERFRVAQQPGRSLKPILLAVTALENPTIRVIVSFQTPVGPCRAQRFKAVAVAEKRSVRSQISRRRRWHAKRLARPKLLALIAQLARRLIILASLVMGSPRKNLYSCLRYFMGGNLQYKHHFFRSRLASLKPARIWCLLGVNYPTRLRDFEGLAMGRR